MRLILLLCVALVAAVTFTAVTFAAVSQNPLNPAGLGVSQDPLAMGQGGIGVPKAGNASYWTPTDGIAGCNIIEWYSSDFGVTVVGSAVTAWAEKSGTGDNMAQGTASAQPIYVADWIDGQPGVRLGSWGYDFIQTGVWHGDVSVSAPWTLLAVIAIVGHADGWADTAWISYDAAVGINQMQVQSSGTLTVRTTSAISLDLNAAGYVVGTTPLLWMQRSIVGQNNAAYVGTVSGNTLGTPLLHRKLLGFGDGGVAANSFIIGEMIIYDCDITNMAEGLTTVIPYFCTNKWPSNQCPSI